MLWQEGDLHYLFYAANDYTTARYAIGYAVAESPLGPYRKAPAPLLVTDLAAGLVGPGGPHVVVGPDGGPWLLFHSWAPGLRRCRCLHAARLNFSSG